MAGCCYFFFFFFLAVGEEPDLIMGYHSPMGMTAYAKKTWEAFSQEQGRSMTAAFGSSTVPDWLKLWFNDTTFNVVSRTLKEMILHPAAYFHAIIFCFVL